MRKPEQRSLIGHRPWWAEYWRAMPEFVQEDLLPVRTLKVYFQDQAALEAFERLTGVRVYHGKWCWYPHKGYARHRGQYWGGPSVHPRYPVYVISKGRWESRLTARSLDAMGVPYRIVVEPQERDRYAAVIDPCKLLVLPFSNLGQGSIPARNWVWEHSSGEGARWHWILDDNIRGFYRLNRNVKRLVTTGAIFRAAEDFVGRYENVAQAGFQYESFVMRRCNYAPLALNTRVYSCILLRNDLFPAFRWRGRYNEDTDLSLRLLKAGFCTVLFNAFLANKIGTMRMRGGNTEELYRGDGRLKMAESLREQHPDLAWVTEKWGRPQHHVNYFPFKFAANKLKPRPGIRVLDDVKEYGMVLRERIADEKT